jgi:hypothetical protein
LFYYYFFKIGKLRISDPGNFLVKKPVTRLVSQEHNKVVSDLGLSNQHFEWLEFEIGSMKRNMHELIQGLSAQLKQSLLEKKEDAFSSKISKNKGVGSSS